MEPKIGVDAKGTVKPPPKEKEEEATVLDVKDTIDLKEELKEEKKP